MNSPDTIDPAIPPWSVRSAVVLGAGVMGAQIAAHLANAGLPVLLLDLTTEQAAAGIERLATLKPDPLFTREHASLITPGDLEGDLARISTADWVIEAIVEQLDAKRALLARVDALRRGDTVVSTNTSGIPIAALAEGRSAEFRRRFLGTHFFNPPRYLPLLEVIPTADTDPQVVQRVSRFADVRLGKGVVIARDTPGFIANRLGIYGMLAAIAALEGGRYSIEEIDAMTGPPLGRPKSATFRTLDIAGLDIVASVLKDLSQRVPAAFDDGYTVPPLLARLVERGRLGEKSGEGFYKRKAGPGGTSEILVLDPESLTYRPRQKPSLPALESARSSTAGERIRALFTGQHRVGEFLRETLTPTLVYAAEIAGDVAHSPEDVDRAMRWGFGWELGPFALIEAIGPSIIADEWRTRSKHPVPMLLESMAGATSGGATGSATASPLAASKAARPALKRNDAASLVDLGDGVLAIELHSKMNVIGGDTLDMIRAGLAEGEQNFAGVLIASDAAYFSAGANLALLLLEAQEGNWDEIDLMVRTFQQATAMLRQCRVPVVAAPAGLALGGGCEIALQADRVHAAAETYMGLVEVGVGLIPAAGGTKEMLAREVEPLAPNADLLPAVQRVFETIGFAKVSTSAPDARRLGYLRDVDTMSMNRERLVSDAKHRVLDRARDGYQPSMPRAIRVGGDTVRAPLELGVHLAHRAGRISDHDALLGRKLAHVLAGGDLPSPVVVSEQYVLDLEREAFLSLCGEARTLERIAHTLKTGKPLRN